MVLILHKEVQYKVEKLKCKKLEVMQSRIKNKLVNKSSRISPHEVLQSWSINTVYHLLLKIIIHSKYFPYSDWLKAHA